MKHLLFAALLAAFVFLTHKEPSVYELKSSKHPRNNVILTHYYPPQP
jgi:hypothetical protein